MRAWDIHWIKEKKEMALDLAGELTDRQTKTSIFTVRLEMH